MTTPAPHGHDPNHHASHDSDWPPGTLHTTVDNGLLSLSCDGQHVSGLVTSVRLESFPFAHPPVITLEQYAWIRVIAWLSAPIGLALVITYTNIEGVRGFLVSTCLAVLMVWAAWSRRRTAERLHIPKTSHRLRVWLDQASYDFDFEDPELREHVATEIRQGMQATTFQGHVDVSGNGNAINIGNGNTASVLDTSGRTDPAANG